MRWGCASPLLAGGLHPAAAAADALAAIVNPQLAVWSQAPAAPAPETPAEGEEVRDAARVDVADGEAAPVDLDVGEADVGHVVLSAAVEASGSGLTSM